MANPNIVNVTSILGNTAVQALTTAAANVLTVASSSNTVVKLNTVSIVNYSANNISSNVMLVRSGSTFYMAGNISVPAQSTLVVVAKDTSLYLIEGDYLQASVSANTSAHVVASYESIS